MELSKFGDNKIAKSVSCKGLAKRNVFIALTPRNNEKTLPLRYPRFY